MFTCVHSCQGTDSPITKRRRQEKTTPASTPVTQQSKQNHVETPPLPSVEVKDVEVEDVKGEEWRKSVEEARKSILSRKVSTTNTHTHNTKVHSHTTYT